MEGLSQDRLYQIFGCIIGRAFKGGREKKKKKAQRGMHNSCVFVSSLRFSPRIFQHNSLTAFHMLLVPALSSTLSTHSLLSQSMVGLFVGQDYWDGGNVSLGKGPVGAFPLSEAAPAER